MEQKHNLKFENPKLKRCFSSHEGNQQFIFTSISRDNYNDRYLKEIQRSCLVPFKHDVSQENDRGTL